MSSSRKPSLTVLSARVRACEATKVFAKRNSFIPIREFELDYEGYNLKKMVS